MLDRDNQDYVRVTDNYIDRDTKIILDSEITKIMLESQIII